MKRTYDPREEAARACRAHIVARRVTRSLQEALDELAPHAPFSVAWVASADRQTRTLIDAFLKRFENVVEAGGKLFRAALFQAGDDHRSLAPSEVEQRLESYGFIESSLRWRQMVGVRNVAAHDYADDDDELAEALTETYRAAVEANRTIAQLLEELRRRFPESSPQESDDV